VNFFEIRISKVALTHKVNAGYVVVWKS